MPPVEVTLAEGRTPAQIRALIRERTRRPSGPSTPPRPAWASSSARCPPPTGPRATSPWPSAAPWPRLTPLVHDQVFRSPQMLRRTDAEPAGNAPRITEPP